MHGCGGSWWSQQCHLQLTHTHILSEHSSGTISSKSSSWRGVDGAGQGAHRRGPSTNWAGLRAPSLPDRALSSLLGVPVTEDRSARLSPSGWGVEQIPSTIPIHQVRKQWCANDSGTTASSSLHGPVYSRSSGEGPIRLEDRGFTWLWSRVVSRAHLPTP